MGWEVEYTDEFEGWWDGLDAKEQSSVSACVDLLALLGPGLRHPHTSDIKGSKMGNLRELRIQHAGRPYRVLYAFDPRRSALLLIGGNKTGQNRWYEENVPLAEKLYDEHLETLRREGRNDG
ncbi:MAG: addiction module toxin RelE [Pseudomonas sp.]|nr:addiction module toxin RelE [Pseudomonas sp.]